MNSVHQNVSKHHFTSALDQRIFTYQCRCYAFQTGPLQGFCLLVFDVFGLPRDEPKCFSAGPYTTDASHQHHGQTDSRVSSKTVDAFVDFAYRRSRHHSGRLPDLNHSIPRIDYAYGSQWCARPTRAYLAILSPYVAPPDGEYSVPVAKVD